MRVGLAGSAVKAAGGNMHLTTLGILKHNSELECSSLHLYLFRKARNCKQGKMYQQNGEQMPRGAFYARTERKDGK